MAESVEYRDPRLRTDPADVLLYPRAYAGGASTDCRQPAGNRRDRKIVEQTKLVAHIEQRDSAETEDDRVYEENATESNVDGAGVAVLEGRLEAGQAGQGATDASVPGDWIGLEHLAAGE